VARSPKSPAPAGAMSIGALSKATGIAVETLRTWERRYGVPVASRKPSGHRLYPAAAVEPLRRVAQLLARGHRPAEVLALAPAELAPLLALSEGRSTPPIVPPARTSSRGTAAPDAVHPGAVAELLDATRGFDRDRMLRMLRARWSRLGPLRFLDDVAGPFLVAIGAGWEDGEVRIRHEHFATECLSDFLREVRGPHQERADGPLVVAATLEGDRHEGGLLMATVLLAVRGWRVLHLGPDSPVAEIVELARTHPLDAVAISVSSAVPRARAARMIATLRRRLPRRVALWVGGAGAPPATKGVDRFDSFTALDARLATPD